MRYYQTRREGKTMMKPVIKSQGGGVLHRSRRTHTIAMARGKMMGRIGTQMIQIRIPNTIRISKTKTESRITTSKMRNNSTRDLNPINQIRGNIKVNPILNSITKDKKRTFRIFTMNVSNNVMLGNNGRINNMEMVQESPIKKIS
jgi:hypothetical protein